MSITHPQKPDLKQVMENQNELEEYLHLASHELKGPLRKIKTFAELFRKDSSELLNKDSAVYLERLMKNIYCMQALLDDLTDFTTFNAGNVCESCDLTKIFEKAIKYFEPFNANEKPLINAGALPFVNGNADSLKEVFKALISNSLKFRSPDRPLQITISSEEISEEQKNDYGLLADVKYQKINFADNGIGFNHEDEERIFKPFVRLNGKSAFKGNGLGLALCKKILDAHNGIIYASGNQSGCCITLILPISG